MEINDNSNALGIYCQIMHDIICRRFQIIAQSFDFQLKLTN